MSLTGKGSAGPRGGPAGDLYVHLKVAPSERFARAGYDLVHILHVPFTSAALGVHLPFETMDGDRLISLWQEHYSKARESGKTLLPLVQVHFLAPIDE